MTTYILTSPAFEGEVLFGFDAAERLLQYDVTGAALTEAQMEWLTQKLPRTLPELKTVLKAAKEARLVRQQQTATRFEQFWFGADGRNRWPRNSSKLKAMKRWNALSQRQRDRAVNYLPAYLHHLPDGVAMMYAETYLSRQLWEN